MFCKKCGNEIKPGTKFCVKCGNPVPEMKDTVEKPKKKNIVPILVILLMVVLVIGVVVVAGVMFVTKTESGQVQQEEIELEEEKLGKNEDAELEEEEKSGKNEKVEEKKVLAQDEEAVAEVTEVTEVPEISPTETPTVTTAPVEHTYQIIAADVSWTEAYNAAREIPNGYLVNIDTAEEYNKILAQINQQGYNEYIFWIGAMRRKNSNSYHWVDKDGLLKDEELNGSSYWLANEPSFYDYDFEKDEQYVDMFFYSKTNSWVWNDVPDDLVSLLSYYSGKMAYIVEIENE